MSPNTKSITTLAAGLCLLLITVSTANAEEVIFDGNTLNAIGIDGLVVGGTTYNIRFRTQTFATEVYGEFPGNKTPLYPFTGDFESASTAAREARNAILDAFNNNDPVPDSIVDEDSGVQSGSFNVGFYTDLIEIPVFERLLPYLHTQRGAKDPDFDNTENWINTGENQWTYHFDEKTYVEFQETGSAPPATVGGDVVGLEGSGLVLQNNGGDDETITGTGEVSFTFDTALAVGSSYEVTVKTEPTNPNQFCSVINGSGTVRSGGIDDVVVSCRADNVTIGGTVSGLEGSGLILENNGTDDETISDNGDFTFNTPVPPGSYYSVTVATQPSNPKQFCAVTENATGEVPSTPVTDVTVTCGLVAPTVVFDPNDSNRATGIRNLLVGDSLYDVDFKFKSANQVYGDPLSFDFPDLEDTLAAMSAVITTLNSEPAATTVGPAGGADSPQFFIGSDVENGLIIALEGTYLVDNNNSRWLETSAEPMLPSEAEMYADFRPAVGAMLVPAIIVPTLFGQ